MENLVKFTATTFGSLGQEQKEMVKRMSDAFTDAAQSGCEVMNRLPRFEDIGKRLLATSSDEIQLLR